MRYIIGFVMVYVITWGAVYHGCVMVSVIASLAVYQGLCNGYHDRLVCGILSVV
jgi:hypothetical protein